MKSFTNKRTIGLRLSILLLANYVSASTLVVNNLNESGPGTLRQAIFDAHPGDTITFAVSGAIILTTGELHIAADLTIKGPSMTTLTVNGNNASRVFNISSGNVAISDLAIAKGVVNYPLNGGGVFNQGILSLTNCLLTGNVAFGCYDTNYSFGGAIFNSGSMVLDHCILSNNVSCGGGSGIQNDISATLLVNQSTLISNLFSGVPHGGEALGNAGTLTFIGSTILGTRGGGLFSSGNLLVSNSNISSNSGGGIYTSGPGYVAGSMITGNSGYPGGGINNQVGQGLLFPGSLLVSNCNISGNYSGGDGGGILNYGTIQVISSTLSNNWANGDGGGIENTFGHEDFDLSLSITNSTLNGNRAAYGGGGLSIDGGKAALAGSTVSGNRSVYDGGGVYISGGSLDIVGTTITSNSATNLGGGVFADGPNHFRDTIIAHNTVGPGGGHPDCTGTLASQDYNLIENTNGARILGLASHNIYSQDPKLGPLQDNGGPTWTHALLPGSPAIDKGNSFGVTTDQRGSQRPYDFSSIANAGGGDGSDIGAFELLPSSPLLNIAGSANNVLLSWSADNPGYTLEAKTNLSPAILWTTVPGTPATVGSQYVVTNGPVTGNMFYRLKQ